MPLVSQEEIVSDPDLFTTMIHSESQSCTDPPVGLGQQRRRYPISVIPIGAKQPRERPWVMVVMVFPRE